MSFSKIMRAVALLLVTVLLLSFCSCSAARKARPNSRANKVVATAGELEITYDMLYYVTMTRIAELKRTYGDDVLNDPAQREALKTFVTEHLFTRSEALLLLAKEYGVDIGSGEIADNVQADMETIIANERTFKGDRKAYIDSLNAEYLTDRHVRTYLAVERYLPQELVRVMLVKGDIDDSDETARTLINGDSFIRTVQVFIDKNDGLFTVEEDLAHATKIQETVAAAPTPAERYQAMRKAIGGLYNRDTSDTTGDGYYFARGEMESAYETAAFALEEFGVSPVVETVDGYYVIMRLPKDAAYMEKNFQALKEKSYYVALNAKLDEKLSTVRVEMTKFGNSLDLLDLPPLDADGGEVPFIIAVLLTVLLSVALVVAVAVFLVRAYRKKHPPKRKKKSGGGRRGKKR